MHRRLVYMHLLNVSSVSSPYFNKIKQTSRLGKYPALSLEILYVIIDARADPASVTMISYMMGFTKVQGFKKMDEKK